MFYLLPLSCETWLILARRADTWVRTLHGRGWYCFPDLNACTDSFLLFATTPNCIRGYPVFVLFQMCIRDCPCFGLLFSGRAGRSQDVLKWFFWRYLMIENRCLAENRLLRCERRAKCVDPQSVMRCYFSNRAETRGFCSADFRSGSRGSLDFFMPTRATHFRAQRMRIGGQQSRPDSSVVERIRSVPFIHRDIYPSDKPAWNFSRRLCQGPTGLCPAGSRPGFSAA